MSVSDVSTSDGVGVKSEVPTLAKLIKILEVVKLGYILPRFNGLDSMHDWASVLSLGEQQRLAFARLLLAKPTLVLLDESTSALDEANEVTEFYLRYYTFFRIIIMKHCSLRFTAHQAAKMFSPHHRAQE